MNRPTKEIMLYWLQPNREMKSEEEIANRVLWIDFELLTFKYYATNKNPTELMKGIEVKDKGDLEDYAQYLLCYGFNQM